MAGGGAQPARWLRALGTAAGFDAVRRQVQPASQCGRAAARGRLKRSRMTRGTTSAPHEGRMWRLLLRRSVARWSLSDRTSRELTGSLGAAVFVAGLALLWALPPMPLLVVAITWP